MRAYENEGLSEVKAVFMTDLEGLSSGSRQVSLLNPGIARHPFDINNNTEMRLF
jgi:hypothetical protein